MVKSLDDSLRGELGIEAQQSIYHGLRVMVSFVSPDWSRFPGYVCNVSDDSGHVIAHQLAFFECELDGSVQ
jgi:hypothetical protein